MATEEAAKRGQRKERRGAVVSKSGDKSIVVRVDRRKQHPLYGKVMTQSRKFHVHDENNEAEVGDIVIISEMRRKSRLKRWRLAAVAERRGQGA